MKNGKGPLKGLVVAAGTLVVMLVVAVFSFMFVSAGEDESASDSESASRYIMIGEGTTPHSKSTRLKDSPSSSSSVSSVSVPVATSSQSRPDHSEPVQSASPSDAALRRPDSPAISESDSENQSAPQESSSVSELEHEPPVTTNPPQNTNSEGKERRSNWANGAYLGSTESDKYHDYECRAAKNILPENEVWFESEEEAKAAGYSRCGICW